MMLPLRRRSTRHELRLLTARIAQLEAKILDLQQLLLQAPALPTTGPIVDPLAPLRFAIPTRPAPLACYPERKISKAYLIKQSHEVVALDQNDCRLEQYCGPLYQVGPKIVNHFRKQAQPGKWMEVDQVTGEHRTISLHL